MQPASHPRDELPALAVAVPIPANASRRSVWHSLAGRLADHLPGITLAAALASLSLVLGELDGLQANGMGALTLAIVFGMVVGNTLYPRIAAIATDGVLLSKQRLLRLGIVLYGLRLSFQDIGQVGPAALAIDAIMLCSTFALACFIGIRLLRLAPRTAILIGAGSSICGAAAVMATEPVVRGRSEQVAVAISTVVAFGTLAIFVYPALYQLNARHALLPMSPAAFGIFAGSTIHEVAQVVAAGRSIAEDAANTAVIVKMVRVMMLAPFLLALSFYFSRRKQSEQPKSGDTVRRKQGRIVIPWFALGFLASVALSSLGVLPARAVQVAANIDTFILAMAMVALGLTTQISAVRNAGTKPLLLAGLLFAWLVAGGAAVNVAVTAWLG